MDSITKRNLTQKQILAIVKEAFGEETTIHETKELTDGMFNLSYLLVINDNHKVVLKVAPEKNVDVLKYETSLMTTEVEVLNEVDNLEIQSIPRVLYYGNTNEALDGDYFFMEFVEGTPMNLCKEEISCEALDGIYVQMADLLTKINGVEGTYFGFINLPDRRYDNWFDCFEAMILDLIEDSKKKSQELPIDLEHITQILENHKEDLESVEKPFLLHKDLWEGNVFIDHTKTHITGIIDFERAIYGDELLEVVCAFVESNEVFLEAYFGRKQLSESEQRRVLLYRFYLFLMMTVECAYRGYSDDGYEKWVRTTLGEIIEQLSTDDKFDYI